MIKVVFIVFGLWVLLAGAVSGQAPAIPTADVEIDGVTVATITADDLVLHAVSAALYRTFGDRAVMIVRAASKNNTTELQHRPGWVIPSVKAKRS